MLDPSAPEAYYLACLLDHNEYSRREAASGLLISDELNQACSWIKTNTALDPVGPSGVLMTRLNALMAASSPLAPRSDIQWGAATEWGAGTQVLATLRAGGHPTGSDAGGDPEWMLQLQQRMDRAGKSLYVRGHLLNRHLGGPGLDYNMVPLTASGAWGANDANKAHSSSIEETVKDIAISLDNGGPDAVTGLRYGVQAIYGRAARAQTAQVAALAATFKGVVDQYQKLAAESVNPAMMVGIDAKSDADVQAAYLSLMAPSIAAPSPEAAYPSGGYDRAQVIGTLRMAMSGDFMQTTIAKLPPVLKDWFVAAVQAGSPILESVLNAVSPLDYKLLNISEVSHRMRENAALWQLEDTRVPIRLDLIATWTQFGNVENLTQSIDIRLPSSLNAAFSPRYDDD
ncbi:MAG: hypothetical protein QOE23_1883 [Pseudonocardiales bacterium]|nr:hypothetical protein [Pseudonocardiales bacterium]